MRRIGGRGGSWKIVCNGCRSRCACRRHRTRFLIFNVPDIRIAFLARHSGYKLSIAVLGAIAIGFRIRCRAPTFRALVLLSSMDTILYAPNVKAYIKDSTRHDGIWRCGGTDTFVDEQRSSLRTGNVIERVFCGLLHRKKKARGRTSEPCHTTHEAQYGQRNENEQGRERRRAKGRSR